MTLRYIPDGLDPALRDLLVGINNDLESGVSSDPGVGVEYIFTVTTSETFQDSQLPSNDWGFDQPGTVDSLVWTDDATSITQPDQVLWRSSRRVAGVPTAGAVVEAEWTAPIIVGRYVKGSQGEDGNGIEYIFAISASSTFLAADRPLNTWGFDQPGTAGGLMWSDDAPDVTAAKPFLWRAQREVEGVPTVGAAVTAQWRTPRIVGRYGPQGDAGEDGSGFEYIYAVTNTSTIANSKLPSNTWGYDQPGTVDELQWHDDAPATTKALPVLWRAQRVVPGTPALGAAVTADWSAPTVFARYGDDGHGFELVYAVTRTETLTDAQLPSNEWGFDSPGTSDTLEWHDDAPAVTASAPNLWRSQREVNGRPAVGTLIAAEWSAPRIVARYGPQGQYEILIFQNAASAPAKPTGGSFNVDDGVLTTAPTDWSATPETPTGSDRAWASRAIIDPNKQSGSISPTWSDTYEAGGRGPAGADGQGFEFVYTATNTTSIRNRSRPNNNWGYDQPGTRGGQQWYDDAPSLTAALPNLWRSQRAVPGTPTAGDAVTAQWSVPRIVGHYGSQGDTGAPGAAGADGADGVDGEDGSDGVDGFGFEYVFAATNTSNIATSKRPDNAWGFDSAGTSDDLVWSDDAPSLSSATPVLWRSQRVVSGTPTKGDAVTAEWSGPVVVGRYGETGEAGADGEDGSDGAAGYGFEYVFAATDTDTLAAGVLPLNTWGFDSPVTRGEVEWQDEAPSLSTSARFLWRAQRAVQGTPIKGAAVTATWSTPKIVGAYGETGEAGADGADGADGSAGYGFEYVFTATNTTTIDTSKRPNRTYGASTLPARLTFWNGSIARLH